jgi:hypothetical protein
MRDPFKNRTIEDLAIQYVLLSGPNPPIKMYSALEVHLEITRRIGGGPEYEAAIDHAHQIMKMVDL